MTAPTIVPDDPDALLEFLDNPANVQSVAAQGPDAWKAFAGKYRAKFEKKDAGVTDEELDIRIQAGMADFLRKHEVEDPKGRLNLSPKSKQPTKGQHYSASAPGAVLDELFVDTADFLRTIFHGTNSAEALAKRSKIFADYSSTVPSEGGFTIPESLRSTLLALSLEASVVRSRAFVVPMETLRVPFPTIDSVTNAGSVFGGMIGYWTEESAEFIATAAKFGQVILEAKLLSGYSEVPNTLIADSILSMVAFIENRWPQALAFFEDMAFFAGTGVGEPQGFMNADAAVVVPKETGQVADTIVSQNIYKMYARMLPQSMGNAVWVANQEVLPELATMAQVVGTGGGPVFVMNAAQAMPMTLMGRPLILTEKAEALGDEGDIAFVDLSYYLIGDRQQMVIENSPHFKFSTNKTAFRVIERVDGTPWIKSAITPAKGTKTLSPFVKLAAR